MGTGLSDARALPVGPRTPGRVSGGVFGRVGCTGPWNFLRRDLGFGKRQNGARRSPVVLPFHTDGVMPARNRDVHSEHGRTVTPPALVTIECRGPDGMPAVVVHRIVVSGASRQYPPDAADESSSTACSIATSALPKGPPMTSAISNVQGSDSAGNAVEPVTETVLVTTHGTTSIADIVIAKIAGLATREIAGVYRVGGRGAAGTFGSIRQKIPGGGSGLTAGVAVEVGARQSAVDLDIVVEYGVEIGELTKAIRRNVISAIERMTTLEVTEVNIVVHDVHLPQEVNVVHDDVDLGDLQ